MEIKFNQSNLYTPSARPTVLLLLATLISSLIAQQIDSNADSTGGGPIYDNYARPGIGADELLQRRGFSAKRYVIETKDGYLLELVRGNNSLFAGATGKRKGYGPCKYPILFVHGTFGAGSVWLSQAANTIPKDFTNIDVNSASEEQLHRELGGEPSARSLPFLLLNFGCDVWILERRTSLRSINLNIARGGQKIVTTSIAGGDGEGDYKPTATKLSRFDEPQDGTQIDAAKPFANLPAALVSYGNSLAYTANSLDRKYWNFSLDEQSQFDLTAAVDKVLELLKSTKLILFGHSSGGAITLMRLASTPEFADKIQDAVLYAPAFHVNGATTLITCPILGGNGPREMPIIPLSLTEPLEGIFQLLCTNKTTQSTICPAIIDAIGGPTGGQSIITPTSIAGAIVETGLGELYHLCQFQLRNVTACYDFGTDEGNEAAYGQPTPPVYNLANNKLANMLFFAGGADTLISVADVQRTVSELTVPYEFVKLDSPGLLFDHFSYFSQRKIVPLVVVRTLKHLFRQSPN